MRYEAIRVACCAAGAALSTMAQAQVAEPQKSDVLEEVVVTAQFRQENLQQTPLSITALSAEAIEARGMSDITAVSTAAPNVNLRQGASAFGKSLQATIRGLGEGDYNFAVEPSIGIYVDDVYHATVFGGVFNLLDLERVEVLRGPQGTLFGKNSIGGVVRLVSAQPRGDNTGYLEVTGGSRDRLDVRGSLDVPVIAGKLLLRMSGGVRQQDGYGRLLDFGCANPTLTGDGTAPLSYVLKPTTTDSSCVVGETGDVNVRGARATLRWLATDKIEVSVAGDYTDDSTHQSPFKLRTISAALGSFNTNIAVPQYGVPFDSRFLTASPYDSYATFVATRSGLAQPNLSTVVNYGVSGTVDWQLAEGLALKSITASRKFNGEFGRDGDGSPLGVGGSHEWLAHDQFSQEFRLSGTSFKALDWTLGAYYFDGDNAYRAEVEFPTTNTIQLQDDPSGVKNQSAFLHGTFRFTDRLSTTAAVRYTDEEKSYTFSRMNFASRTLLFPITGRKFSYGKVDWRAGVEYQLTPDVMIYGNAATGFRAGGFNPRPTGVAQVTTVGPEDVLAYELGVKSELWDRRVRLNVAVFQSDYDDLQLTAVAPDSNGIPNALRTNVGEARIRGAELELQTNPFRGFRADASVGYTDFEYRDLGPASAQALIAAGFPFLAPSAPCMSCVPVGSPKTTYNIGAQYSLPLGVRGGTVTVRGDYSHKSRVYFDLANTVGNSQAGYGLLNARVVWDSPDSLWSLAVFGNNLQDKLYYESISPASSAGVSGTPSRPQEYGVTIKRSF